MRVSPGVRNLVRWIAASAVLVMAWMAALGNAPGPQTHIERRTVSGKSPPRLNVRGRQVTLPAGQGIVAAQLWQFGQSLPILRVRAVRPHEKPLPHTFVLASQPLRPPDYEVVNQKGPRGHVIHPFGELGWYALEIWDAQGVSSVLYYEVSRSMPRGYLSCGKRWRKERKKIAQDMAPAEVRRYFARIFREAPGYLRPRPLPAGAPVAAPPPKAPPPKAPPARKR